eukprot:IDg12465t1
MFLLLRLTHSSEGTTANYVSIFDIYRNADRPSPTLESTIPWFSPCYFEKRLFNLLPMYRKVIYRSVSGLEEAAAHLTTGRTVAKITRKWEVDRFGREIRTAKARRLGITTSPHKLNLVARLVRGMPIAEAQRQLVGCRKLHSTHVSECISTAFINAQAFGLREDRLVVHEAFVGKGKYLKKVRPWHGKGRYGIEEKKYAHLTVILRELDDE